MEPAGESRAKEEEDGATVVELNGWRIRLFLTSTPQTDGDRGRSGKSDGVHDEACRMVIHAVPTSDRSEGWGEPIGELPLPIASRHQQPSDEAEEQRKDEEESVGKKRERGGDEEEDDEEVENVDQVEAGDHADDADQEAGRSWKRRRVDDDGFTDAENAPSREGRLMMKDDRRDDDREKSQHVPMTVADLPDEIIQHVFQHLPPKELVRTSAVCQRWMALSYDPRLWAMLRKRHLGETSLPVKEQEGEDDESNELDVMADSIAAMVWLQRQKEAFSAFQKRLRWAVQCDKWIQRLLWSATHGYIKPLQKSLAKLECLFKRTPTRVWPFETKPLGSSEVRPSWRPHGGEMVVEYAKPPSLPLTPSLEFVAPVFDVIKIFSTSTNAWAQKALFTAAANGREEVMRVMLDEMGILVSTPVFEAGIKNGGVKVTKLILNLLPSSPFKFFTDEARTLSLSLALSGQVAELELLQEQGLLEEGRHAEVLTKALIHAVIVANEDLALTVLKAGANPNAVGERGRPILLKAISKSTNMVRMLLDFGANFQPKDEWRYTPLERAVSRGATEVVELLLERGAEPYLRRARLSCHSDRFDDCMKLVQRASRAQLFDSYNV